MKTTSLRVPRSHKSGLRVHRPIPDPAQPLANARHEAFVRLQAAGQSGTEAYLAVYGRKRLAAAAHAAALRTRAEVMARMRHLQGETARAAVMDLREMLEFLTRVKRTPISQVDGSSDIVRVFKSRAKNRKRVRMLDKRVCVERAARMQGFLRGKKVKGAGPQPTASAFGLNKTVPEAKKRASPGSEGNAHRAKADPGLPLANPRHETFARLLASGLIATQAYLAAYRPARKSAESYATHLRDRLDVAARVEHLQSEARSTAVMDLAEILGFLTLVVRTPAGQLDEDNELVQGIHVRPRSTAFWIPGKLACLKLAARVAGL